MWGKDNQSLPFSVLSLRDQPVCWPPVPSQGNSYHSRLQNPLFNFWNLTDPMLGECREEVNETTEHCLNCCPALYTVRVKIFN